MKIEGRDITESAFIIAEAGSNHNGSLQTAKKLIDAAVDAGADAVKFQTFRAEDMYVRDTGETEHIGNEESIYDIMESMEMPYDWIPELHNYCKESGITFLSTPFDERSADKLAEFVPAYKIASFTLSHHPFLRHVADTNKPVLLSTGAHELDEVRESVAVLRDAGVDDLALLHCVSSYPTPIESANVRAIQTLQDEFDAVTGFSDHTTDPVTAPSAAVSLGGRVIEKHFTLDKSMEGPDHSFALEPDELDEMVTSIRKTEKALGDGTLGILEPERELYNIARRRIHAACDIPKGTEITEQHVEILRSGKRKQGLKPKYYQDILGRETTEKIREGDGVTWDELENANGHTT